MTGLPFPTAYYLLPAAYPEFFHLYVEFPSCKNNNLAKMRG
ncbi:hypothetical protein SAMN06297382_1278 [Amphiplicatus metriothermophilus]|uniref:Uncharacterized protein n=1 Tax=Amphiplicatus metriothermophilus TaxID=1519374 RepID=A0A239PPK9_9PROT|nr:hypothetical protein [Amphiplicatus metriothermophilus]SNT72241.1 hypothetical protein SAMN06297382_1278 [Amphiplicatus metriothermophilus]